MNMKSLLPAILLPSGLLLIPAAAMLFRVEGWAWGPGDFLAMWIFLVAAILAYKLLASKAAGNRAYRVGAGLGLATGMILIWINGAVGVIGSEENPANALYFGVLAIGAIGTAIARLGPVGMARTLFATALAQFMVPVIALFFWRSDFSPGVPQVFGLNFIFVLLFAGSALLFQYAGNRPDRMGLPTLA